MLEEIGWGDVDIVARLSQHAPLHQDICYFKIGTEFSPAGWMRTHL